jgi:putative transposon-encoded protein
LLFFFRFRVKKCAIIIKMAFVIAFETTLISLGHSGWVVIPVTHETASGLSFPDKRFKRVVCRINGAEGFQCALMPSGTGGFIITVNKKKREACRVRVGELVNVELELDTSKYGLPMPEELREVLAQDPEADRLFHALTPGKQRSLLYQANQKTDVDLRIHRALIIVGHLKENDGAVDWRALGHELKRPRLDESDPNYRP